jgi:ATP-binding cassette subfamily B protein
VDAPITRLLRYSEPHRRTVVMASAYSVLNKLFDLAPPLLIGLAVDTVVAKETSFLATLGVVEPFPQLVVIAVLTVIIWGLESVFEYLFQVAWRNLAQTVQHELRLDAYGHVQQLDMDWFADKPAGEVLAILNDDINQLERFLDGGANQILQLTTTVITVTATFFWVSPAIAIWSLLPVPIILWGSLRFQSQLLPRYADVRQRAARLSGQLTNNLGGIETIKAFVAEDLELERLRGLSQDYREANRAAIALSSAFIPLIRMAIVVGFTATLVYGGWLTLEGELAVGTYSVLVFMTQRLLWPLTRLGEVLDGYNRAMASTSRVLDLLDTPVGITDGPDTLPAVQGAIRFEGIDFAYPGRDPILQGFDLDVRPGTTVAIVGPTGAGKSTLVRLLLRFHDPASGRITLDGHDLRDVTLHDLRKSVGLVSQRVFLLDGSVADNIAYGADATREEVVAAAERAEADGFVDALPEGYDAQVGERGQKLSGGQAQRLSIARALLKLPPVLVFDEATSAVDNETEAAIQRSLARVSEGRTVLVIAHRLSTIRHADEIVVMDGGRIVERGQHAELLARRGVYARLWAIQTGERAA